MKNLLKKKQEALIDEIYEAHVAMIKKVLKKSYLKIFFNSFNKNGIKLS